MNEGGVQEVEVTTQDGCPSGAGDHFAGGLFNADIEVVQMLQILNMVRDIEGGVMRGSEGEHRGHVRGATRGEIRGAHRGEFRGMARGARRGEFRGMTRGEFRGMTRGAAKLH